MKLNNLILSLSVLLYSLIPSNGQDTAYGNINPTNYKSGPDGVFYDNKGVKLSGDTHLVQLYSWKEELGFVAVGEPIPFSRNFPGLFYSTDIVGVFSIFQCGPAWIQFRAWEKSKRKSREESFEAAALSGAWTGCSNIILTPSTGCSTGSPPRIPPRLTEIKYPGPPVIVKQPEPQTIQAGSRVEISVVASSGVEAKYQWYKNPSDSPGGIIYGANRPTYVPEKGAQETEFWVIISNVAGAVTSKHAKISVTDTHLPWFQFRYIYRGSIHYNIIGKPNTEYLIQYSDRLTNPNWSLLEKVKLWHTGHIPIHIKINPNQPSRFLRLKEVAKP
ncbi:MAG: hypothetical protein H8E20_14600 [Verrucomicrobia bacterium]|nr:hypothetical protein [Verrucomicrobiota bacterium]